MSQWKRIQGVWVHTGRPIGFAVACGQDTVGEAPVAVPCPEATAEAGKRGS